MVLQFSQYLRRYLLYLCLEGADGFERVDDNVIDRVIHGFDLDIYEELLESFLCLAHS